MLAIWIYILPLSPSRHVRRGWSVTTQKTSRRCKHRPPRLAASSIFRFDDETVSHRQGCITGRWKPRDFAKEVADRTCCTASSMLHWLRSRLSRPLTPPERRMRFVIAAILGRLRRRFVGDAIARHSFFIQLGSAISRAPKILFWSGAVARPFKGENHEDHSCSRRIRHRGPRCR